MRNEEAPATSYDAIKVAIKLAVDAGDYDTATALLEVAKRARPKPGALVDLAEERARREKP